ncbi:MAG: alpha-mannosidase [Planctomycetota bacterium]
MHANRPGKRSRALILALAAVLAPAAARAQEGATYEPGRPAGRVVALAARCEGSGNSFLYYKISEARHAIARDDILEYDLYIDPASPQLNGGVDIQLRGGENLRDSGATDQRGLRSHPNQVIKAAAGRWIHRKIPLGHLEGRVTGRWDIVAEGDRHGLYIHYADNIIITRGGETVLEVFLEELPMGELDWQDGYDIGGLQCALVEARERYPRGFALARGARIDPDWVIIDLGEHYDVRGRALRGETVDFDGAGHGFPAEEFPRGLVHRGRGAPLAFASEDGRDHVRAAGQRLPLGKGGGARAYDLHLAIAAAGKEPVESVWGIIGEGGERRPLALRVPSWLGEGEGLLARFTHIAGEPMEGRPGLAILSLPIAAAFPISAIELPDDALVRVFALSLERRDDALRDGAFRRTWLAREGASEEMERYLRNLRLGPHFTDLAGEEKAEMGLFEGLLEGDRAGYEALLGERLREFAARGAALKKDRVFFAGESHIDLEWLWPWRETINVCRDTYSQALRFMEEYPEFRFSQGIAQTYLWMKAKAPQIFEQIRERVKTGQWELVGGSWTEPDFNMPLGESQARQILKGWRFFKEELGREVTIGWSPDSFGYCHQLPQLLRSAGIDSFGTTKMLWNDTTPFPYHLFWWRSPDGSTVLACTPPQGIGSRVRPDRIANLLDQMEERHGARVVLIPFGVGDHGGGPSRRDIEMIRELQQTDLAPTVAIATFEDFLAEIRGRDDVRIPVVDDELYLQYHRGTYTSQGKIKWYNRKGEVLLLDAERFAVLAAASGPPVPVSELREMWRRVLFHQCHDGLPGTSIPAVKKDIAEDYAWVLPTGDGILRRSLAALARTIDTRGPGDAIVVFNPLSWERRAPVELPSEEAAITGPDGERVPVQRTRAGRLLFVAEAPPLGYSVYRKLPLDEGADAEAPASALQVDGWSLSNEHLRAEIDPETGHLKSVRLLEGDVEILAGDGNQLELYTDRPPRWDAWNLGLSERRVLGELDSIEIVERGPVRALARVERSFGSSRLTQEIVLHAGVPWIEFRTRVDWREDHKLLRAAFPLRHWSPTATFHVPFGTQERPAGGKSEAARAMFEVAAIYWGDQANGVGAAILNDSKYGYSASREWLRLSLLKAATWPDPAQDQGEHHFAYALYPHRGDWMQGGVMRAGHEFNHPHYLLEVPSREGPRPARHSFLEIEIERDGATADSAGGSSGVLLSALKPAEDGDGFVVRLHEYSGRAGKVRLLFDRDVAHAERADILERPAGEVTVAGRGVALEIGPHRIESLRVRLAPVERE